MKNKHLIITGLLVSFAIGFYINAVLVQNPLTNNTETRNPNLQNHMKLGAFSISLSVNDLKASKEFHEKLGFHAFAGSMEQNYHIMKNDNALIGLFQGMFEGNILTFNPGWNEHANNVDDFTDIREIQKQLLNSGLTLTSKADENTEGPASLMLTDPDGNMILLDQHR